MSGVYNSKPQNRTERCEEAASSGRVACHEIPLTPGRLVLMGTFDGSERGEAEEKTDVNMAGLFGNLKARNQ